MNGICGITVRNNPTRTRVNPQRIKSLPMLLISVITSSENVKCQSAFGGQIPNECQNPKFKFVIQVLTFGFVLTSFDI
jgi:hypothetical protein